MKRLIAICLLLCSVISLVGCATVVVLNSPAKTDSTTVPTDPTTVPPTTLITTEPTTDPTTVPSTIQTTEEPATIPTTKATTKDTTRATTKSTTKPTTKATTNPTTKRTTKPTTKATTNPTTKPTTTPTTKVTEPIAGDFVIPSGAKDIGPFEVEVVTAGLNLRKGPGTNYDKVTMVNTGDTLTITKEYNSDDYVWVLSEKGWTVKSLLKFPLASDDWPYQMKINGMDPIYGDSSRAEVVLGVDSKICLEIVDEDDNAISVDWNVDKPNCCTMVGNQVRRYAKGTTTLTAKYEDYTFVLVIH